MSCIDASQLSKMIDIPKFNTMIQNTTSVATNFLTSFLQEQQDIKNNNQNKQSSLENDRYRKTALDKRREMIEAHNKTITTLKREVMMLEQQTQSVITTTELLRMLEAQNKVLKANAEKELHTIELSDRKTYYEYKQNTNAGWWSDQLSSKYWWLILLLLCGITLTGRYTETKLWIIIAGLVVYPYVAFAILNVIIWLYNWVVSNTKLVYLYSNM